MRYTIHRDGETFGPYTIEQVREYQTAGSIVDTDLAQIEGNEEMVPVSALTRTVSLPPPPLPKVQRQETDVTGGVIPYKNGAALTAYYLAVFSLIPGIGLFLGPPAFFLGIIGFNKYRRNPAIRGQVHAWIGIILGGLVTIGYVVLIVFFITAAGF